MFDEKSIAAVLVTFPPPQRRTSIAIRQSSKAMRSAWLRRPKSGSPYAQGEGSVSLTVGPARRRFRLHRCERWRCRWTARTATDGAWTQPTMPSTLCDSGLARFSMPNRVRHNSAWNNSSAFLGC